MHRLTILALQSVVPMDLIIPLEIFSRARTSDNRPCYQVKVCSPVKSIKSSHLAFRFNHNLAALANSHTIVIPGTDPISALPNSIRERLIRAHKRGVRIISICSGAFHLAETGLLDGRGATTHWLGTNELKMRYPSIKVDPNVLYVDEGTLLTSAGGCAGIDLCLHVIRKDFGAAVASQSARIAVMPLERAGGQAQHIIHPAPLRSEGSLSFILDWLESNLEHNFSIQEIAKKACMSVRTLNRQFKQQTGTTPLKWLIEARVRRAMVKLETTDESIELISETVGFGSSIMMREYFKRILHTSPKSYRESYQKR